MNNITFQFNHEEEKDLLLTIKTPEQIIAEIDKDYVIPYHLLDHE